MRSDAKESSELASGQATRRCRGMHVNAPTWDLGRFKSA